MTQTLSEPVECVFIFAAALHGSQLLEESTCSAMRGLEHCRLSASEMMVLAEATIAA